MPAFIDLTGQQFERLTVIKRVDSQKAVYWLCRCDCGKDAVVNGSLLRGGKTKSCGCLNREGEVSRTCQNCGKVFHGILSLPRKFCSRLCFQVSRNAKIAVPCSVCGKEKYVKRSRASKSRLHFCGIEHRKLYTVTYKKRIACKICGKVFAVPPSYECQVYCSQDCYQTAPETKARLIGYNLDLQKGKATKLEKVGYSLLDSLGIPYTPQKLLFNKFCVDAFVDVGNGIVIQFDGDYWHGNPARFEQLSPRQKRRKNQDASQDAYLRKCGMEILRLWESDVYTNLDSVKNQILEAVSRL